MTTQTLSANVNGTLPNVAYNDIYLNAEGNIALSFNQQALLENCSQAAQILLGELVFNTSIGIPYQQALWVGVPNIQQFTAALRRAFLSIDGVLEVISLITSQGGAVVAGDTLTYTAIIRTIYGVGGING